MQNATLDDYKLLNLQPPVSEKDVYKAFRNLSLKTHPDKFSLAEKAAATEKYQNIGNARDRILNDLNNLPDKQSNDDRKNKHDKASYDDENDKWEKYKEYLKNMKQKMRDAATLLQEHVMGFMLDKNNLFKKAEEIRAAYEFLQSCCPDQASLREGANQTIIVLQNLLSYLPAKDDLSKRAEEIRAAYKFLQSCCPEQATLRQGTNQTLMVSQKLLTSFLYYTYYTTSVAVSVFQYYYFTEPKPRTCNAIPAAATVPEAESVNLGDAAIADDWEVIDLPAKRLVFSNAITQPLALLKRLSCLNELLPQLSVYADIQLLPSQRDQHTHATNPVLPKKFDANDFFAAVLADVNIAEAMVRNHAIWQLFLTPSRLFKLAEKNVKLCSIILETSALVTRLTASQLHTLKQRYAIDYNDLRIEDAITLASRNGSLSDPQFAALTLYAREGNRQALKLLRTFILKQTDPISGEALSKQIKDTHDKIVACLAAQRERLAKCTGDKIAQAKGQAFIAALEVVKPIINVTIEQNFLRADRKDRSTMIVDFKLGLAQKLNQVVVDLSKNPVIGDYRHLILALLKGLLGALLAIPLLGLPLLSTNYRHLFFKTKSQIAVHDMMALNQKYLSSAHQEGILSSVHPIPSLAG